MQALQRLFDWVNYTSNYLAEKLPELEVFVMSTRFYGSNKTHSGIAAILWFDTSPTLLVRTVIVPELTQRLMLVSEDTGQVSSRVIPTPDTVRYQFTWPRLPKEIEGRFFAGPLRRYCVPGSRPLAEEEERWELLFRPLSDDLRRTIR